MLYVAGIDLGGTKILTALADTEGRVVQEIKIPTQGGRGFDHVVERMAASVGEVLARDPKAAVSKVLLTLDIDERTVEEAVRI
ncbi:hypothetical protein ACP3TI_12515, partial [Desulforudis sp. 1190]